MEEESPKAVVGITSLSESERNAVLERLFVGNEYAKSVSVSSCDTETTREASVESEGESNQESNMMLGEESSDQVLKMAVSQGDDNNQETTEEEKRHAGLVGVSATHVTNDHQANQETEECAICLSEYVGGELVSNGRSCHHVFHRQCLLQWLESHDHCPVCRKRVMTLSDFRGAAIDLFGRDRVESLDLEAGRYATTQTQLTQTDNSAAPAIESHHVAQHVRYYDY